MNDPDELFSGLTQGTKRHRQKSRIDFILYRTAESVRCWQKPGGVCLLTDKKSAGFQRVNVFAVREDLIH